MRTDDDPFAVDTAAHAKAVQLLPQPEKGRRHAIKCPMCETVGYTSTKAAGREVRCANPKCMVPIFTAPDIEKPPEPEAEGPPKPRFTTGMLAAASAVGLVVIGVCLWLFVFSKPAQTPGVPLGGGQPLGSGNPAGGDAREPTIIDHTRSGHTAQPRAVRAIPPAELRKRAFESMVNASQEGHQNRRSMSVRLTAEAYAASGDTQAAYEQLSRMQNVRPVTPYYAIPPLVEIAWTHLAAGRRAEAESALKAALVLKNQIAQLSQDPWEAAVGLAALLVAFDRDREAAALLRDRDREEERVPGVLWAQIRAAHVFESYDIDEIVARSPLKPWKNPAFVAVVFDLGARQQFAAARRWSLSRNDTEEQADCLAAWAESLARPAAAAAPLDEVRQAVRSLTPPLQAYVLARLALGQAAQGDQTGAAATLAAVREILARVAAPAPFVLPDESPQGLKSFLALRPAPTVHLELAAIAAAEAARVEALLGKAGEAWQLLEQALAYTRGMAPSRPAVNLRLAELKNRSNLDYRLGLALETSSADRKRIAFLEYQSKVEQLARMADTRLELQVAFLSEAIDWKLADRVWKLVPQSPARPEETDPYLTTSVPWLLVEHFQRSGAAAEAQAVLTLLEQEKVQPPTRIRVRQELVRLSAEGKGREAARVAERWPVGASSRSQDETERNRWILRACARLVKDGHVSQAFQLLETLRQSTYLLLRHEGYDLSAALATRSGHAQAVWQVARGASLDPVERAAALRGMVVALDLAPAPAEEAGAQTTKPAPEPTPAG